MQQTDSHNFQQERCPTCHSGLTCPICKQIAYGILSEDVFGIGEGGFSIQSLPAFEMGTQAIGLNDEMHIPSDSCLLNICSPCRGQLGFAKLHEMNREKLQKIWKDCTTEYRGQVRECFPPPDRTKIKRKTTFKFITCYS